MFCNSITEGKDRFGILLGDQRFGQSGDSLGDAQPMFSLVSSFGATVTILDSRVEAPYEVCASEPSPAFLSI
jgi:hypothetical protein